MFSVCRGRGLGKVWKQKGTSSCGGKGSGKASAKAGARYYGVPVSRSVCSWRLMKESRLRYQVTSARRQFWSQPSDTRPLASEEESQFSSSQQICTTRVGVQQKHATQSAVPLTPFIPRKRHTVHSGRDWQVLAISVDWQLWASAIE